MKAIPQKFYKIRHLLKEKQTARQINNFIKTNQASNPFSDFSKHTVIFGVPRGGTTWLMELLHTKEKCIVWEPLTYEVLKSSDLLEKIGVMPFIPENEEFYEAEGFFRKILSGHLHYGIRMNFNYGTKSLSRTKSLIVKFCRGNMLLPWFIKQFPSIKPILLIRHPLAVIASQYRHGAFERLGRDIDLFASQKSRFKQIFERYQNHIDQIDSRDSFFANWWAIQYADLLKHPGNNNLWHTVAYESLLMRPEYEIERLRMETSIDLPQEILKRFSTPSLSTVKGSAILNGGNQLETWKNQFSNEQINKMLGIIQSYGIDAYDSNPEPNYSALGYSS